MLAVTLRRVRPEQGPASWGARCPPGTAKPQGVPQPAGPPSANPPAALKPHALAAGRQAPRRPGRGALGPGGCLPRAGLAPRTQLVPAPWASGAESAQRADVHASDRPWLPAPGPLPTARSPGRQCPLRAIPVPPAEAARQGTRLLEPGERPGLDSVSPRSGGAEGAWGSRSLRLRPSNGLRWVTPPVLAGAGGPAERPTGPGSRWPEQVRHARVGLDSSVSAGILSPGGASLGGRQGRRGWCQAARR